MDNAHNTDKMIKPVNNSFNLKHTDTKLKTGWYKSCEYFDEYNILIRAEVNNPNPNTRNAMLTMINMTNGNVIGEYMLCHYCH